MGLTKEVNRGLFKYGETLPIIITTIAVIALFAIFVPTFRTVRTFSGVVSAASINGIIVCGITLLMIAGEFDLSVGSVMAMGGYIFAAHVLDGKSPIIAIVFTLAVTTIMGAINGFIRIGTNIPSFIVTLGTRSIFRAAVWLYSGGIIIQTTERLPIFSVFNGRFYVLNNLFKGPANFRTSIFWVILVGLIFHFLLNNTKFGNHVFASGGNSEAATAQGVKVKITKLICFSLSGLMAGLAGIMTFSQHNTVAVSTGTGVELVVIAGAVVGGALLSGGVGSIVGGLAGILLINALRSGVVLLGFPSDNFEAIVGVTIIGAVIINRRIQNFLTR